MSVNRRWYGTACGSKRGNLVENIRLLPQPVPYPNSSSRLFWGKAGRAPRLPLASFSTRLRRCLTHDEWAFAHAEWAFTLAERTFTLAERAFTLVERTFTLNEWLFALAERTFTLAEWMFAHDEWAFTHDEWTFALTEWLFTLDEPAISKQNE
jgi:hypothetical protein